MTEWIEIPARFRARAPVVTIALGIPKAGSPLLRINASRSIGDALGWKPKDKVAVGRSKEGDRLRISLTTGAGFTIGMRDTTLTFGFRLPWLAEANKRHPSKRTPHRLDAGALVIDLPAWALMPTSLPAPISRVEAIAEAKREALELLAAGRSVRDVADIVGETPETIRAWRAAAPGERREA